MCMLHTDGIGITECNQDGQNLLHIAVQTDAFSISCIDELLSLRVDGLELLDAQDYSGNTPLMLAVQSGREHIVAYMLSRGCDQSCKNHDGLDACAIARLCNNKYIEALLYSAKQDDTPLKKRKLC